MSFKLPEKYRVTKGPMATNPGDPGGFFLVRLDPRQPMPLRVIASDGSRDPYGNAWDHVSISLPHRCPSWEEMCEVKALFWDDEDPVMQLHPPKSQWISNHKFCLHLWRPLAQALPLPPASMVGVQSAGEMATVPRAKRRAL
jgi:hypothetical protein